VPILNFALIFALSVAPSNPLPPPRIKVLHREDDPRAMAMSVGIGLLFGAVILAIGVLLLAEYGASLFLGAPLLIGSISGYVYSRNARRTTISSVVLGVATMVLAGCLVVAFAVDGAICVVMALPIAIAFAILGAVIGKQIAERVHRADRGLMGCAIALLICLPIEAIWSEPNEYVVLSSVEIAASPDQVWNRVVAFPEIDGPDPWLFRLGIAAPRRARIEGSGIGAVRYCEFTTGDFVEPITAWEPGRRLAFDVAEQPDPMFELSPYGHIHPPHLDGFLTSKRGEFRLVEVSPGKTRLEGRTWYEVDMYPQAYWRLWCDAIVHQIHLRVLRHIASLDDEATAASADR
jgi:hypothetical protein